MSHTLRKTVASFLDDADVSTRRISDQLGHAKVSMTQDRYLGRRLTDRETAEVLEACSTTATTKCPKTVLRSCGAIAADRCPLVDGGPPGDRTPNPRIKSPLLCRLS